MTLTDQFRQSQFKYHSRQRVTKKQTAGTDRFEYRNARKVEKAKTLMSKLNNAERLATVLLKKSSGCSRKSSQGTLFPELQQQEWNATYNPYDENVYCQIHGSETAYPARATGAVLTEMVRLSQRYSKPDANPAFYSDFSTLANALDARHAPFYLLGLNCDAEIHAVTAHSGKDNDGKPLRFLIGFLVMIGQNNFLVQLNVEAFEPSQTNIVNAQGTVPQPDYMNTLPSVPESGPYNVPRSGPYNVPGSGHYKVPGSDRYSVPRSDRYSVPRSYHSSGFSSDHGRSISTGFGSVSSRHGGSESEWSDSQGHRSSPSGSYSSKQDDPVFQMDEDTSEAYTYVTTSIRVFPQSSQQQGALLPPYPSRNNSERSSRWPPPVQHAPPVSDTPAEPDPSEAQEQEEKEKEKVSENAQLRQDGYEDMSGQKFTR